VQSCQIKKNSASVNKAHSPFLLTTSIGYAKTISNVFLFKYHYHYILQLNLHVNNNPQTTGGIVLDKAYSSSSVANMP